MKSPDNHSSSIYIEFLKNCIKTSDKTALIFEKKAYSYRDLQLLTDDFCNCLQLSGIKQGEFVAVLLPNCVEYVVLMLAAAKLRLILVPYCIGVPLTTITRSCKQIGIDHYIIWHGLSNELHKLDNTDIKHPQVICIGGTSKYYNNYKLKPSDQCDTETDFDLTINNAEYVEDYPYIICMTSGSTGDPKPILLTQKTKLNRIKALESLYNLSADDITLAATPLYHSLAMRLVLQPLVMGGTSVLLSGFSVNNWLLAIEQHQVSFTIAVSSQLKQIEKQLDSIDTNLRVLVSSSEQLPLEIKHNLCEKLQCEFHECYGTSEVAIVSNLDTNEQHKLSSVGKAIPGVDITILDDDKKPVPINTVGEIACKTNMLFSGYLNKPEATTDAFHEQYYLTSDLGYLDEDGYLYFKGRKNDLIISGGINIYPKDIEDVIRTLSGVKDVAVVGKNDEQLGEVVSAVIVKQKDSEVPIRSIKQHCAANLADFQFPKEIHFTDSLPKNNLGKIQKHRLQIANAS